MVSFTNHGTSVTMHQSWDFRIPPHSEFSLDRPERQQKTNGVEDYFNDCNKSGK